MSYPRRMAHNGPTPKAPAQIIASTDSAWHTDCNASFVTVTGGCDALTKTQFGNIDDTVSGRVPAHQRRIQPVITDWQTASAH